MATVDSVLSALKSKGKESTRRICSNHGMDPNRVYGVSVADMKLIAKPLKGQQALAAALMDTGIMDAMYLAGMVADGAKVTSRQLEAWLELAAGLRMISEYTIPWFAVEHPQAAQLASNGSTQKRNTSRPPAGPHGRAS